MVLSQAWRSWRRAKVVALLAATALACGIGAATSIYTVVNAVMLKPLSYRDGDRFVAVFGASFNDPEHYTDLLYKDAEIYQQRNRVFDAFGWFRFADKNLTFNGEPHHVQGVAVTLPFVRDLGVSPAVGQWFNDQGGVVISNRLWRQLGGDSAIIGKGLTLDGRSYNVTGVMPSNFYLPVAMFSVGMRIDLWMPLDPAENIPNGFFAYARRKSGVTVAAAEADVKRIAAEIAAENPENHRSYTARLRDLRQLMIEDIRPTLLLLFAAAGLLFLITCANAAGLLLARSVERARETAIRVALGAKRSQLAAHFFLEGLFVSAAGAVGGVLLSAALTPAIVSMAADYLPRAEEIALDWKVLLFAAAAAFVASALSSLAPLWQASQTAPADALGEGIRASAGARARRVSQSLVVAEIALAFGLLAVSAVLIIQLRNLSRISPGFEPDNVLTFVLSIPSEVARDDTKRIPLQRRLIDELRAIPGVQTVAITNHLPLNGCCFGGPVFAEGRPANAKEGFHNAFTVVSPDYFQAMKIPLKSGRLYTDSDATNKLPLVVLNQTAAKQYWGDQNPVGTFGRFGSADGDRFQVIGVVSDAKNETLGGSVVPELYLPSVLVSIESMNMVVRSARPPSSLLPDIRAVVRRIDPEQPISDIATMREIVQRTMTLNRTGSFLVSFFAGVALLLATLGVYGVVAYSVRQRTVEIGTRMALGSTSSGVLSLIVGSGLKMAAYGVIAGGILGAAGTIYLRRLSVVSDFGVAPFLYSTSIVAAVSFAASVLPAWRASALSPMVAIRNDGQSMWQLPALMLQRVAERTVVPLGTLISEFAASIRRAESFSDALQVSLETLKERVGARSIMLLDKDALPPQGVLMRRLRHYPHPLTLAPSDFDTWKRWAAEFKPEHSAEIAMLENTGARIAVPLRTKNEILGVLLLGAPKEGEVYTRAEKEILSNAAEVFALMIENARLTDRALEQEKLRRELELAAEVQRRLLPPEPPVAEGATLAAFTLPARTVGGDYYDFLELPDGNTGIAIADISGKGIAAALLMSVVQASLRVISAEGDTPLSKLAERMNGFLYRSSGSNKYATFFYAQLEDRSRRLHYVNAGHNPPYLVRKGEILELAAGGTVIGLFPSMQYEGSSLDLRSGDLLVAFTDGVTEALNPAGEEFGEERLKQLLRDCTGFPADAVSSKISDRVRDWIATAEQHDDLTLVVVAVT